MPILRVARANARIVRVVYARWAAMARAICLILGFWGSKVPQNWRLPALDSNKPPCKI